MGNRAPISIFTDQDQAMANGIAHVFPDTRHRLCLWHISKNAPSHLNSFNSSREFHSLFNKCLYQCETKEEFEQTWNKMIQDYNAHDHRWLNNLYKIRDKWSSAFNSDYFHGGVRSTFRSESTNHALNEISSKTITLSEFVLNFEKNLLGKWRRNESDEDFFSSQSSPPIAIKDSKILNHAIAFYTNTMYKEFEKDYLAGTGALSCKEIPIGDTLYEFVFTYPESNNSKVYTVFLDISTLKVECSCKKFNWMGMLCSHALAALHRKDVHELPQCYVHSRWTKDAKKKVYKMNENELMKMEDKEARLVYTNRVMGLAYDLVTRSACHKESRDILWRVLKDGAQLLDNFFKNDSTSAVKDKTVRNDSYELSDDEPILDPLPAKVKGTRNSRIKSHFEKRKTKTTYAGKSKKRVVPTVQVSASSIPVAHSSTPIHFVNDMSSGFNVGSSNSIMNFMPQTQYATVGSASVIESQYTSFNEPMSRPQSFTSMMQEFNQRNNLGQDPFNSS